MSTIWRILRYGVQGFRRNVWLSIIAIITMVLTLTTITVFAVGDMVAAKKYDEFNQKIDYIIFLRDSASEADVQSFYSQLQKRDEVSTSSYFTKDQVLSKFEQQFKDNSSLKGIVSTDNNPLPREIDLKFHDPKQIDSFNKFVTDVRFDQVIENTTYTTNKSLIDNYVRWTNMLKLFGISFTIFFILIAMLVILNTIRMAIFSRREEIEIMRLVGATPGYIRGPFLLEGLLFGLLGALISSLLFWGVLHQLSIIMQEGDGVGNSILSTLQSSLGGITQASGFNSLFGQILGLQLIVGIILGVSCSYLAARRYLRD